MPVYEVYKVGEDIHSVPGLNFFGDFELHLSIIPHWNNAEGGDDVDTSRCFVGMQRFDVWCREVPPENTTIGLDEHTGLILDFDARECEVSGVSSVSLVRDDCKPKMYPAGEKFPLSELGPFKFPESIQEGIPAEAWDMVVNAPPLEDDKPSEEVVVLADRRQQARKAKNWAESDNLRDQIAALGWTVQDTPEGPKLVKS